MTEVVDSLNASITLVRHPGDFRAGVQKRLKTKEKAKTWIPD